MTFSEGTAISSVGDIPGRDVESSSPEALGTISDGRHRKRAQSRLHGHRWRNHGASFVETPQISGGRSIVYFILFLLCLYFGFVKKLEA
jgi:hypothetical protein